MFRRPATPSTGTFGSIPVRKRARARRERLHDHTIPAAPFWFQILDVAALVSFSHPAGHQR
jgi:hypothetical protein